MFKSKPIKTMFLQYCLDLEYLLLVNTLCLRNIEAVTLISFVLENTTGLSRNFVYVIENSLAILFLRKRANIKLQLFIAVNVVFLKVYTFKSAILELSPIQSSVRVV